MNAIKILLSFSLLSFFACEEQTAIKDEKVSLSNDNKKEQTPVVEKNIAVQKSYDTLVDHTQAECTKDDDCALIPTKTCLGCMKDGAHEAVSKSKAESIMKEKGAMCIAEVEKFFNAQKNPKAPPANLDESCKMIPKCVQNKCVLKTPTEAETKAMMEQMKNNMPQQQPGEMEEM